MDDEYDLALQLSHLADESQENRFLLQEDIQIQESSPSESSERLQNPQNEAREQNDPPGTKSVEEMEAQLLEMQKKMQLLQEEVKRKKGAITPIPSSTDITKLRSLVETDLFASDLTKPGLSRATTKADRKPEEKSVVHEDSYFSSDDDSECLTSEGRLIKKRLAHMPKYDAKDLKEKKSTWKSKPKRQPKIKEMMVDGGETEFYSGLKIVNPLISFSTIHSRMEGRRMIRLSLIQAMMKDGDIEGDWVTIGVVVSKLPPKVTKTGKSFSIWKLSDLRNCSKLVSVFLFGGVHHEHWKTSVGTVVGFLNPTIMSKKDDSKYNDLSLTVDQPGKVMLIGTSKEMGFCKSRTKSGDACGALVNLSVCDVCDYHVQARYKKLSSRRADLQGTFSGVQPNSLKSRILNKQQIMYGGHVFVSPPMKTSSMLKGRKEKNQLTFESLKLRHRAKEIEKALKSEVSPTEPSPSSHKGSPLPDLSLKPNTPKLISKVGNIEVGSSGIVSVTPKELLKMQIEQMRKRTSPKIPENLPAKLSKSEPELSRKNILNLTPQIGRGLTPGDDVCLEVPLMKRKADSAKLQAIEKIKRLKGAIEPADPNAVKKKISPELQEKIKKRIESEKETPENASSESKGKGNLIEEKSRLKKLDLNSPEIQEIIKRKSSHNLELEQDELERQEKYFNTLEKKEQMETKMELITQLQCDVISCKQCHYTAYQPTELCKNENHLLVQHKATKRFFRCTVCGHRTVAFTRLPTKACRQCGELKFERTSMMKPRNGPKLDNETLLLRGEEIKFLNSMKN